MYNLSPEQSAGNALTSQPGAAVYFMLDVHLTDEELVHRCAAGDRHALAMLYDRYGVLVFSLVVRVLGEGMTAEEVTQDAFLSLWRRSADYAVERGRVLPWLLTIARNRAIDELRRRRVAVDVVEMSDQASLQPGLEDVALRRLHVRRALGELPAAQREVLELAYYGGMTQQEIAAHLRTPLGTIKTRMRLGLQRLRAFMEDAPVAGQYRQAIHPGDDPDT